MRLSVVLELVCGMMFYGRLSKMFSDLMSLMLFFVEW